MDQCFIKLNSLFLKFLILLLVYLGFFTSCQSSQQNKDERATQNFYQQWFSAARLNNKEELIKIQQVHSLDWDVRASNGLSALMQASRFGHKDLVLFLLEKKVDVNAQDQFGFNAFSYVLYSSLDMKIKKELLIELLYQGADPFQKNKIDYPVLGLIYFDFMDVLKKIQFSKLKPCDQMERIGPDFSIVDYLKEESEADTESLSQTNKTQTYIAFFKKLGCR